MIQKQQITDSLTTEFKEAASAILAQGKLIPRIPVAVFKSKWLSLIFNENDNDNTNWSSAWIRQVAGTPYTEVHVIDETGKHVATVPSFCYSTSQYFSNDFDVTTHMKKIRNASMSGHHFKIVPLQNQLLNNVQDNPIQVSDFKHWVNLAEYFNKKPSWLEGFKAVIEKYTKVENNGLANSTSDTINGNLPDDTGVTFEPV